MPFRFAPMLLAVPFTLFTTGCSYLFMEPPPPQHARLDSFQCRTSKGTPTLDTIVGIGEVLSAIAFIAIARDANGGDEELAAAYAISNGATGVVTLASAVYGFSAASECNDALEALAQRQQQARGRATALEEFRLQREHARARQEAMESNAPTRPALAPFTPPDQAAPSAAPAPGPSVATPPAPATPRTD